MGIRRDRDGEGGRATCRETGRVHVWMEDPEGGVTRQAAAGLLHDAHAAA
jgi:hypothetical protein